MIKIFCVLLTFFGGFSGLMGGTFQTEFINASDKPIILKMVSINEKNKDWPGPYNDVTQEIRNGETVVFEVQDDVVWKILLCADLDAYNFRSPANGFSTVCGLVGGVSAAFGVVPISVGAAIFGSYFMAKAKHESYAIYSIYKKLAGGTRCIGVEHGDVDYRLEHCSFFRGLDDNGDIIFAPDNEVHKKHRVTIRSNRFGTGIKVFAESLISDDPIPGTKRITRK